LDFLQHGKFWQCSLFIAKLQILFFFEKCYSRFFFICRFRYSASVGLRIRSGKFHSCETSIFFYFFSLRNVINVSLLFCRFQYSRGNLDICSPLVNVHVELRIFLLFCLLFVGIKPTGTMSQTINNM
jgi:hypothetical protein